MRICLMLCIDGGNSCDEKTKNWGVQRIVTNQPRTIREPRRNNSNRKDMGWHFGTGYVIQKIVSCGEQGRYLTNNDNNEEKNEMRLKIKYMLPDDTSFERTKDIYTENKNANATTEGKIVKTIHMDSQIMVKVV